MRKAYIEFATHVYDVPSRMLALLILILFVILPYIGISIWIFEFILTPASIIAILAISWDLLVGRTGQISLGHAVFFGIGGYTTALLFKYLAWPVWLTIPLSLITGAGAALIIGIPCQRVKTHYLALVTMALPVAITGFLYYYKDIFGGESGIRRLPRIFERLTINDLAIANYYLSLALLTISFIIIYKIATSKTGMIFVAILDDELGVKSCGINVSKYKLMSFAISGLFGSLAGALYAHIIERSASPKFFLDPTGLIPIEWSIIPIITTILGGIGTIYGPVVGVYIYYILDRYVIVRTVALSDHMRFFIFISLIIFLIVKWPRGVARAIMEKLEDLQKPREVEEILKKKTKNKNRKKD